MQLGLARELADADPDKVKAALAHAAAETQEAPTGLRELAHGIYPPLLLERGLGEALRAAATARAHPRARPAERARRVHDGGRGDGVLLLPRRRSRTPPSTPATVHAAPVRVWEDEGGLLFELVDDGAGFDRVGSGPAAGSRTCVTEWVRSAGG